MSRILVIGATGFLGAKIFSILEKDHEIIGTYSSSPIRSYVYLDIKDKDRVLEEIREIKPDVIIHTAAYSNPDDCEKNPDLAEKINHKGTANIVEAAKEIDAILVYTSSAYIFDGKEGNYTEENIPTPLNILGKTKLDGENEIRKYLEKYIILRFAISYGFNGYGRNNAFFGEILKGKKLEVNNDQIRQPLLIDDLAQIIDGLIKKGAYGIFNVAGPQEMTKYQLGVALEKLIRPYSLLTAVTSEKDYAPRPKYGTLVTSKLAGLGFITKPLDEGLKIIKKQKNIGS